MKVVIAGGHGAVARLTGRRLVEHGHDVLGVVRHPGHVADLTADGMSAAVLDLETARTAELAALLAGAHCVVFAAGSGPGSGAARTQAVDHEAAVLLADAAVLAGVRPYLLLSSAGVEDVDGTDRTGGTRDGVDAKAEGALETYLRAKRAAEHDVLARQELDVVVLRPGVLTDTAVTGRVRLALDPAAGEVPRADVAAVLAELVECLEAGPLPRRVLELVSGDDDVDVAVRKALVG